MTNKFDTFAMKIIPVGALFFICFGLFITIKESLEGSLYLIEGITGIFLFLFGIINGLVYIIIKQENQIEELKRKPKNDF